MRNLEEFYEGAKDVVEKFDKFVNENGLKEIAKADHICYKCASSEIFEKIRKLFENTWFYQSIIAGRRIAIIKLKEPINTSLGEISLLELSDQKPDGSQTNKFDHIEIYPVGISYEELVFYLEDKDLNVVKVERPHHTTHDIKIGDFLIRLTREPLLDKIKEEMEN